MDCPYQLTTIGPKSDNMCVRTVLLFIYLDTFTRALLQKGQKCERLILVNEILGNN